MAKVEEVVEALQKKHDSSVIGHNSFGAGQI